MLTKKKILVVLIIAMLTSASPLCAAADTKSPDPHKDTSVLVEAFVVKVTTAALTESRVNPIAKAPDGISITNILWCLRDPEKGKVISGAKVTSQHHNEAKTEQKKSIYIKDIPSRGRYRSYSESKSFTVRPRITTDEKISVSYIYSETIFLPENNPEYNKEGSRPLDMAEYEWQGSLTAKSGIPQIVGANQDNDSIVFLIITATIQNPK
mgnify:CR=1 FL=1